MQNIRKKTALLGLGLMLSLSSLAQTTFVVMQPDGTTGKDANVKLKDSGDTFGNANYGAETEYQSDRANTFVWHKTRGLIQFDLASLPYNARIISANLILYGTGNHTRFHGGSNASYLRRLSAAWNEGTVTWNTQPGNIATDEISLAASGGASETYTVNVTDHVRIMIDNPVSSFGWVLMLQDEVTSSARGLSFGSSDNATAGLRPRLELTYALPMEIKGLVTHVNTAIGASSGAIDVSVTNGVPPYTYSWSNSATTQDISSLGTGLYTLTVTDAYGFTAKKYFAIGSWGNSVTVNIVPDDVSGKDNLLVLNDNGVTYGDIGYPHHTLFYSQRWSAGSWNKYRSYIGFDLSSIPSLATVSASTLTLYGTNHSTLGGSNASYLQRVSGSWEELNNVWFNQPGRITSDQLSLSSSSTATQNYSVTVTSHVQTMVNDPLSNHGWALVLQNESSATYRRLEFGSSDHTDPTKRPALSVTFSLPAFTDDAKNYSETVSYDLDGNITSTTRSYTDSLGRSTQDLIRDVYGQVYATQTVYDSYGRAALKTLPAPSGNMLSYNTSFFLNSSGGAYSYVDFDASGTLNSPTSVQNTTGGSVGNYYSDNGPDAFIATTSYPYARTEYSADPMGGVKRSTQPGDNYQMGSGHENRSFTMVSGDELRYIFGTNISYKCSMDGSDPLTTYTTSLTGGIQAVKTVALTADDKEIVSYSAGGQVIASCMSGLSSPDNCSMSTIKNVMQGQGTRSVDIHLPASCKSTLKLPLTIFSLGGSTYTVTPSDIVFTITDLNTNTVLTPTTHYTVNSGTRMVTFNSPYNSGSSFFRISFSYTDLFLATLAVVGTDPPHETVEYSLDYGHWSVSYYDLAGKLRKSVSAKGISCSSPGTISMASVYDYNSYGQMITSVTPDEGKAEMIYDSEGKLRFTQKAEQVSGKKFSYVNYDAFDRVVETGEYTAGNFGSGSLYFQNYYGAYSPSYLHNTESSEVLDSIDYINDPLCSNQFFSDYDTLSTSTNIPAGYAYRSQYADKYRTGQLSRTWNDYTTTWYSYDNMGRSIATVQEIKDGDYTGLSTGAGIKTNETVYDAVKGYVTESHYQKNVSAEKLSTYFTYDAEGKVVKTEITRGANTNKEVLSRMQYYRMGAVKRLEMGGNMQGVDYVYRINGQLKSMNHPSLDETKDPGKDGSTSSTNNLFAKDMFAYTLEYHAGDYTRTGSNIGASAAFTTSYNGLINALHYKTAATTNGVTNGADYIAPSTGYSVQVTTTTSTELANQYTYDSYGRLSTSVFGTYNNSTPAFTSRTDYKEFGSSSGGIEYDANGNIKNLQRNGHGVGGVYTMDNMTYTYTSNTNKLASITDAITHTNYGGSTVQFATSGTSKTFSYDNAGQMTASQAEDVSSITYYPGGMVKKVSFGTGNYTEYFYNDAGQKYKVIYYTASGSTYAYHWYIGPCIYEKQSSALVLTEATLAGAVLKNTGSNLETGELHFALTDHLGNVRVSFKKASNGMAQLVSRNDYYVYGGVMPGRSLNPTDFSFAYQGTEKAKDASRWDQFELRLFNHDLGRWFAPDPYREFSSAYVGMADNPVNATDPNGGQIKYMRSYGLQAQGASAGWNAFHEGLAAEAKMAAEARDLAEMNSYKTTMRHNMPTIASDDGITKNEVRSMLSMSQGLPNHSHAIDVNSDDVVFNVWSGIDATRRYAHSKGIKSFWKQSMQWVDGALQWVVTEAYLADKVNTMKKNMPKQLHSGKLPSGFIIKFDFSPILRVGDISDDGLQKLVTHFTPEIKEEITKFVEGLDPSILASDNFAAMKTMDFSSLLNAFMLKPDDSETGVRQIEFDAFYSNIRPGQGGSGLIPLGKVMDEYPQRTKGPFGIDIMNFERFGDTPDSQIINSFKGIGVWIQDQSYNRALWINFSLNEVYPPM
ncbi:MAG: tRNA3(Ser)-specific nuclease WapA precursor [Bacteroidetes bacterium]|nr:tRNA3(Ser)-specific nuclease WapA precursor [Bacteroidota bacterium]